MLFGIFSFSSKILESVLSLLGIENHLAIEEIRLSLIADGIGVPLIRLEDLGLLVEIQCEGTNDSDGVIVSEPAAGD